MTNRLVEIGRQLRELAPATGRVMHYYWVWPRGFGTIALAVRYEEATQQLRAVAGDDYDACMSRVDELFALHPHRQTPDTLIDCVDAVRVIYTLEGTP